MSLPIGYTDRRRTLLARARNIVSAQPDAFAASARRLDELMPRENFPYAGEGHRYARLLHVIPAAVMGVSPHDGSAQIHGPVSFASTHFDFDQDSDGEEAQFDPARLFVLAMLLGADPEANEVIQPEWGEISSLPWQLEPVVENGRELVLWPEGVWDTDSRNIWPRENGVWKHNTPHPFILDRLEAALDLLHPEGKSEPGAAGPPTDAAKPDMRTGQWFDEATSSKLKAEALRKAALRNRLMGSIQRNGRWLHSVEEVARLWPDHAKKIREKAGQGRTRADTDGQT